MAQNQITGRLVLRNDATTAWVANGSQVLLRGEVGIEFTDNDGTKIKIGDGTSTWEALPYFGGAAGAATSGDEESIALKDGVLSLKNWGVAYYRWVNAVGNDGDENYVAGHHELQIVDAAHPWIAGLEPKVRSAADGAFEIAWYQPSTTTVEGLSSTIASMQTELADKLGVQGGVLTGDLVLKDGGVAISDKAVAERIASAGHLVREIVAQLPAVADADENTIYMVKDASVADGDAYREYMLISGSLVQIGDTSVDLTPYAKKVVPAKENNVALLAKDGSLADGGKTLMDLISEATAGLSDKVEGASIGGVEAEIDASKRIVVPLADAGTPGVVKGSSGNNAVSVGVDGTMSVDTVSTTSLVIPDGDELIICGGSAQNYDV